MRTPSPRAPIAILLAALAVAGCGEAEGGAEPVPAAPAQPPVPPVEESVPIACAVGERPDYFVPAGPGPIVIVGCARLGASGATVEFSVNRELIEGEPYTCVNPAYPGRGRRAGVYIPTTCLASAGRRFDLVDFKPPTQGLGPRYERVVWGTAPTRPDGVVARFGGERTRAASFRVGGRLASRAEVERPFTLFVTELPDGTACGESTVELTRVGEKERIPPRPEVCRPG